MTAREAINALNANKCMMKSGDIALLLAVITKAYVLQDTDAIRWIWLLDWKPQQLVN